MKIPETIMNDSRKIPLLGLGTFPMKGLELVKAVITAEKIGYSLFDTSRAYHNERELGVALKLGKMKREEVL